MGMKTLDGLQVATDTEVLVLGGLGRKRRECSKEKLESANSHVQRESSFFFFFSSYFERQGVREINLHPLFLLLLL